MFEELERLNVFERLLIRQELMEERKKEKIEKLLEARRIQLEKILASSRTLVEKGTTHNTI